MAKKIIVRHKTTELLVINYIKSNSMKLENLRKEVFLLLRVRRNMTEDSMTFDEKTLA